MMDLRSYKTCRSFSVADLLGSGSKTTGARNADVGIVDDNRPLFRDLLIQAVRRARPQLSVVPCSSNQLTLDVVVLLDIRAFENPALPAAFREREAPGLIRVDDGPGAQPSDAASAIVRLDGDCRFDDLLASIDRALARRTTRPDRGIRCAIKRREAEPAQALTPAERRVLDLLVLGQTNKEIAYGVCCSEGTAKVHVTNIMRKLGVHNRTHLALRYGRVGAGSENDGTESNEPASLKV